MKFDVTVNYIVEAEDQDAAFEITQQLTHGQTFAIGSAKVRGFNMYEQPSASMIGGATPVGS